MLPLVFAQFAVSTAGDDPDATPPVATEDVQKKISLLSNSSAIAGELFPRYAADNRTLPSSAGGRGEEKEGAGASMPRNGSGLVVVASLVSKIPNQGGK